MLADRNCKVCNASSEIMALEKCGVCAKYFCAECAHRAYGGRKFCSPECARNYYFYGEMDDDEDTLTRRED